MSESYYNDCLYPFQDDVLRLVAQSNTSFYLTGGTYLGRFLLHHRYSDDLDFFMNMDSGYKDAVQQLAEGLVSLGKLSWGLRDEDFSRVFIERDGIKLKLEFINDVQYSVEMPVRHPNGFLVDTWRNVLANKITALSRLATKDYVDILFLSLRFPFNWEEMIGHAKKKDAWIAEHEIANFLLKFNTLNLNEILFPASFDIRSINYKYFEALARDAFNGYDNSLVGVKL